MTNKEEALLYNIAFSMLGGVTEASKLVMLRHYGSATGIFNLRKVMLPFHFQLVICCSLLRI